MIDKANVRIPQHACFRPEFRFVENDLRFAGLCSHVRRSQHYQGVIDLRPFGIPALLHPYYRRLHQRNHKLELLETGKKSLEQMAKIIVDVFDVDPLSRELMRLDFAADIRDVTVQYLHRALRVRFKRTSDERGELEYEVIGGRRMEYFRYGKGQSLIRVYDKPAECKARFPEVLKGVSPDAELPTFEETFGFLEDAVITRVERQAGGGRVPVPLRTFGELHRAADFNPFTNIEIIPDVAPMPDPGAYGVSGMLKLVGTRALIDMFGMQQTYALINRDRNGKRFMDAYAEFTRGCANVQPVTAETVFEAYRNTVRKQIDGTVSTRRIGGTEFTEPAHLAICSDVARSQIPQTCLEH